MSEMVAFDHFSIDYIIAYLIRYLIVERSVATVTEEDKMIVYDWIEGKADE